MSDLMLLGVLRMPMPQDPQEIGVVEWIQFRSRARQAADRIEADAAEIAKLQARIDALVEALKRWEQSGCPDCGGDCASANPPVSLCIMRETSAAIEAARGE